MGQRGDVALMWPNKDRPLLAQGTAGYYWGQENEAPRPRTLGTPDGSQGLVICGDGWDALTADPALVEPGAVRLLYIDPPFNTGSTFADYSDSMAGPMWLSMLRDRLEAVKPLLSPNASIWVHLDDSEVHRARCVLDEVFGADSFVASIAWQKRTTRESRTAISVNHDTIHVYAPSGPRSWKRHRNLLLKGRGELQNRDHDPRGPWTDAPFTAPGYRPNQQYVIVTPSGRRLRPPSGRSWYATEPAYRQLLEDDRIWFPKDGAGSPRLKLFAHQVRGLVPFSVWSALETGTNDDAKRHLQALFPHKGVFATPKPEELMERIIHVATDPGDLVLDLFAGSGTTATTAHKMGRRWVAVERNPQTVAKALLPRVNKVIAGTDPGGITPLVGWHGGGSYSVVQVLPSKGRATRLNKLLLGPSSPLIRVPDSTTTATKAG
ncbi:site-specific DNA-methyltransferase [Propionibacterium freudenreichii]|nr:site-specific DNA-methyltransferase [Propionibacterium freudenreichii]